MSKPISVVWFFRGPAHVLRDRRRELFVVLDVGQLITVRCKVEAGGVHEFIQCKAEHSEKDELEMCAHDLALERPPIEETKGQYLACAELTHGWTCLPTDEKPISKEAFSRLFEWPTP